MTGQAGQLCKGAFADAIAVPFKGKASEVHEAVVHHSGDVAASMIAGRWVARVRGVEECRVSSAEWGNTGVAVESQVERQSRENC